MLYSFQEWVECPNYDGSSTVGLFTCGDTIVLECYDCGQISEFEIGRSVPFRELNAATMGDGTVRTESDD